MSRKHKPYEPVPGTIPYKVIKHLESLPPGTVQSTPQLVEALGQTHVTNLSALLLCAVKAGWVKREPVQHTNHVVWSLGDRTPIEQQPTEADVDSDTSDLAGPMPTPNLSAASVFAMAQQAASTTRANPKAPVAKPSTTGLRCALYNDGTLYINSNGTEQTLPTDHTRELLRYLDALRPDIGAAA